MKARYVRVSTGNQKTARQEARQSADERIFVDVVSGAVPFTERKQGKELMKAVQDGKLSYVSVSSIDRLGRNLFDIISTLEFFREHKVILKVDNLGIESMVNGEENYAFKLIISVMANIAEMERATLLERQREGIAIAKAKGVYKGREKGTVESDEDFLAKYKEVIKYLKKGFSIRNTAKICNVAVATVQKVKKRLHITRNG